MDQMKNVMDYIVDNRVENLPADAISEVFDRLVWCFADNGAALQEVRREWLQSDDKYRVEVALRIGEVFPYKEEREMESAFARILSRWPDLIARCNDWRDQWKKTFP